MIEALFLLLGAAVAFAGIRLLQRKNPRPDEVEPWDRSWEGDEEPLDEEEIREAEDAFWESELDDSEEWRG